MKHVNVSLNIIVLAKKIIVGILAHVQKLCVMKLYMLWILYQQMCQQTFTAKR